MRADTQQAIKGGVAPCSRRVMNLAHFLTQAAQRTPDAPAVIHGALRLDWRTLDDRVHALAAGLAARGIGKGDRILVHARNCHQLLETQLAAFRLGAVWVPTNFRITPDDVAYLARASGAVAFIVHAEFQEHVAAVHAAGCDVRVTLSIGTGDGDGSLDALVAAHIGQRVDDADVERDDPCWFFFTSGTTGRPKAAVLTHGQMGFVITNHLADLMPGTWHDTDASLVVAPLSHGAGIHFLIQLARAVVSILPAGPGFDPDEIWQLVQRYRVTNLFTVPTIVKALVDHAAVDAYDHSSLRYVIYAGAPMYREDQKQALRKLGPVLVQYFGLGEVTGNITVLPPAWHNLEDGPAARAGTCGVARTAMQVSIQDAAGRPCAPGETGEICVCGPAVFAGYYDNPEANAKAFRNGWFRTGDLGYMDAQGYVFITGRESDMYISGGSNVYPREIEEKVLTHPDIAEVAVVGVPDRHWGEVGFMVCVVRPGASLDEAALMAWMESRLARYRLPRRIVFWDALPKSGYGKVTKNIVRAELAARGLLDDAVKASATA